MRATDERFNKTKCLPFNLNHSCAELTEISDTLSSLLVADETNFCLRSREACDVLDYFQCLLFGACSLSYALK